MKECCPSDGGPARTAGGVAIYGILRMVCGGLLKNFKSLRVIPFYYGITDAVLFASSGKLQKLAHPMGRCL